MWGLRKANCKEAGVGRKKSEEWLVQMVLARRLSFRGSKMEAVEYTRAGQGSVSLRQVCLKLKEAIYQMRLKT